MAAIQSFCKSMLLSKNQVNETFLRFHMHGYFLRKQTYAVRYNLNVPLLIFVQDLINDTSSYTSGFLTFLGGISRLVALNGLILFWKASFNFFLFSVKAMESRLQVNHLLKTNTDPKRILAQKVFFKGSNLRISTISYKLAIFYSYKKKIIRVLLNLGKKSNRDFFMIKEKCFEPSIRIMIVGRWITFSVLMLWNGRSIKTLLKKGVFLRSLVAKTKKKQKQKTKKHENNEL